MEALNEEFALKKVRSNERGVLLQKANGIFRKLPKNVNRARTDGLPQEMALGFYALLESAGIQIDKNGFYFDPAGWITGQIREFLNNQVFARAA